jgi:virulence factor Mce-like protein
MLTRFVKIQLSIFAVVSIVGVAVMALCYVKVPMLVGIGRITVTLELSGSGGLYRFSNVTYRGVQVGKVTAIQPTRAGATATLSLGAAPKIPADLHAEVRSISAVGEQYVDLRPRNSAAPYLHDGSVIPANRTTIPQSVGPMLDQASALISSVPKDKLSLLLNESFNSLNGSGYDLGSLFDSAARVAADANGVADRARTLFDDTAPLLDSQARSANSIRRWARGLAGVTEQLSTDDPQLRRLLATGPQAANEVSRLLTQLKPTLPVLLANMTTLGQVAVTYHASLEQLLVLLPPAIAELQSAQPSNNYTGMPVGGFHVSISDPPGCTVGFLPPSQWRSPADTTTIDTPDGMYCKLPQDSPLAVRGARNYPCIEHPGKRAPTVEICNSDKPFEPLAMREHFSGPEPLNPQLLAQGTPPDDRVTFGDRIFGPQPGTPPMPPPPALPPPPSLGLFAPQSAPTLAPPPRGPLPDATRWPLSGPPGDPSNAPPAGVPANSTSPPPLGPLAPMDMPDPAPPAPAAASPNTAHPSGGVPSAAPSASSTTDTARSPSIAVAKYNPQTGTYVGPDGHLYRQSDVITSPEHRMKTWQELILANT